MQLSISSTDVVSQVLAGKWEHHLPFPHDSATEGTQVSQFLQDMRDGFSLSMEWAYQHLPIAWGIDEAALMPVTY